MKKLISSILLLGGLFAMAEVIAYPAPNGGFCTDTGRFVYDGELGERGLAE